jgi:hypothetical protein
MAVVAPMSTAQGLPHLGLPQRIVDDVIQVRVVLTEVPRGIPQIPEEIRPDEVTAQAPGMPFGIGLQHRSGPTAHLVDIIDLPGGVVQVGDRRRGEQDIVMVGEHRMNVAMPATVSLILKPSPSTKNRCEPS